MSWYNNLLTKTTSQISNLRTTLLSNESDGDTDDDTHVCRVLRNYYTEKGRPFPPWLPQDPKGPAPAPQPMLTPQVGARYGNMGGGGGPQQQGGLSSLWDGPSQAPQPQPQSLRTQRTPASLQPGADGRRPLPSQRPGSYQNNQPGRPESVNTPPAASGGGAGGSAQDRLRQRLWGGSRTTSPSQQSGGQGPFQPPAQSGGGGNYEDRFAPGGMYDGGGGGGGNERPFMGSNSPWAGGGDDYGGGGGGRGGMPRRQGLPSGPRGYR